MVERATRTEIIYLGEEIITGKTRKEGMITEPVARINLVEQNVFRRLECDVDKVAFTVNAKYEEATMKEDVPHFLLEIFDSNNVLIGSKEWFPSRDTYINYDRYDTTVSVIVDVESWRGQTINLRAHLRCWLEESSWTPRGGGEETVSAENYVNIRLIVPEVREPGPNPPNVSFKVVGRTLSANETPKGYEQQRMGEDYKIATLIINRTNNELTGDSALEVYENNVYQYDISPPMIRTAPGEAFGYVDQIAKFWTWYDDTSPDGRIHIVDSQDKIFVYKLNYILIDEYGFEHSGCVEEPLRDLKIVISIPQYKLDAVQTYNSSFDAQNTADIVSLIFNFSLAGAGAIAGYWIAEAVVAAAGGGATGAATGGAAGGATGFGFDAASIITSWLAGKSVDEAAQELRGAAKRVINDPPKFDKNYKHLVVTNPKKVKLPMPKSKQEQLIYNIAKLNLSTASNLDRLIITNSRVWSAKLKDDKPAFKKQNKAFKKFKSEASRNLKLLADSYANLAKFWRKLNIKFLPSKFVALKKQIKRKGLPKEIKMQLRKRGFSNKRIVRVQKAILNSSIEQLDVAKTYLKYSRSLLKLSKSIGEFK